MRPLPPLLAVGHGTRDPDGVATIEQLLDVVRGLVPGLRVEAAFVDDASPSSARALAGLAAEGVDELVILPLLLTPASHSKGDIPGSMAAAGASHPGLRLHYGRPLGPHPLLLAVALDRLAEVGVRPDTAGAGVVLAAAGAADPDANAEVARSARLLWEGTSWLSCEPAFASATAPSVETAVGRLRLLGAGTVAVLPWFVVPGFFADKVTNAARQSQADVVAGVLGAHPALAKLVLARYDEARHGDIRMNCDVCLYRTPVGGRADAVGAAQKPHRHPDDAGTAT